MKKTVITGNNLSISDISNLPANIVVNGESTQATSDGKNKFNLQYVPDGSAYVIKTDTGVDLKNCWVSDVFGPNSSEKVLDTFKPNTKYTMRARAKVVSRPTTFTSHQNGTFILYRSSESSLGSVVTPVINMADKETVLLNSEKEYITVFTTPADMTDVRLLSYCFYGNNDGSATGTVQGEIVISEIMLVEGEYTSDNFPDFELYGISPSPEHISPIRSVADNINIFDKDNYSLIKAYLDNNTIVSESLNNIIYLECLKNTTYTISKKAGKRFGVAYSSTVPAGGVVTRGAKFNNSGENITITTDNEAKYLVVYIRNGNIQGEITLQDVLDTLKVREGSIADPYSSYGKASVGIKQIGKNEFSNIFNDYTRTVDYYVCPINLEKGQEYFLSSKLVGTLISGIAVGIVKSGRSYQNFIGLNLVIGTDGAAYDKSFTVDETYTDPGLVVYCVKSGEGLKDTFESIFTNYNIQLERNEKTSYEPYFSKIYSIQTSSLRSLPNGTKDTIESGFIHRRVGSRIFDGSDDENWNFQGTNYYAPIPDKRTNFESKPNALLCNRFKVQSYMGSAKDIGYIAETYYETGNRNILLNYDNAVGGISNFKQWLSENPMQVDYELEEEIIEPVEGDNLAGIKLNSPISNLSMDSDIGSMTVSYVSIDNERGGSMNPTWIEKNGEKVFPITHSRALLGGISSKAYNINDSVCGNNWNNVTDNGLYYDENGVNRPPVGINTYPDNLLIEVKNIKGKYVTQEVSMFNTELFNTADRESVGYIRDRYGRRGSYNSNGSVTWSGWRAISSESDINRVYIEETSSTSTDRKITMSDIIGLGQIQNKVIYIKSISTGVDGTATLNINGYGAKPLRVPSEGSFTTSLEDNWIITDQIYSVSYDGTNFNIVGAGGSGGSGYVKSSDGSNKDWVTMTMAEFETARAQGLLVDGTVYNVLDEAVAASSSNPVGSVLLWFGLLSKIPANYVLCDGRLLNIEDYPIYADRYGTTYGGDGATTVGVPNMKGRVVVQLDSSQTEFNTVGKTGGSKSVTLTQSQIPAHTHKTSGTDGTTGTKTMILTNTGFTGDNATISDTSPTGGGQAHTNLQPYIVGYYIIKVRPEAYTEDLINLDLKTSMLKSNGDGTKYLSDDGTYKTISGSLRRLLTSIRWYINYNCI